MPRWWNNKVLKDRSRHMWILWVNMQTKKENMRTWRCKNMANYKQINNEPCVQDIEIKNVNQTEK